MAILPESAHAKFLKFLDVSNTNQTVLLSSEYQITVPDEIWAEKLNFPYPKATFFKYP